MAAVIKADRPRSTTADAADQSRATFWRFIREAIVCPRAVLLLAMLVLGVLGASVAAIAISYAQRDYVTALSQRDATTFQIALRRSLLGLALAVPAKCAEEFATGGLALVWRDLIVQRLMGAFFAERALHWVRLAGTVPDPDVRLAQDASHFAESAVLMVRDLLESILRLAGFAIVVARISPSLLTAMLLYAALGTLITCRIFGRPLIALDKGVREQQQVLRRALGSCYESAEDMALSQGERWEAERANERYGILRQIGWQRVRLRVGLAGFRDASGWLSQLLPVGLIAPLYLAGQLELGTVTQAATAFKVSLDALSIVVRKFRSIASLTMEGQRLEALARSLAIAQKQESGSCVEVISSGEPALSIKQLTLWRPNVEVDSQIPLIQMLSLDLRRGSRLLVTGKSGCGKTTLLRSIAGLWAEGKGAVRVAGRTMFLPQRPYLPVMASVRQLLHFPGMEQCSNHRILKALEIARLSELAQRWGLDGCADWHAVLSAGERQRVAYARLLLHQPDIAVLDEASSALDEETEEAMLRACSDIPIIISVGHRSRLRLFHTHELCFTGDGNWTFDRLQHTNASDSSNPQDGNGQDAMDAYCMTDAEMDWDDAHGME
jgi:putative ATP-binding cassette transporter